LFQNLNDAFSGVPAAWRRPFRKVGSAFGFYPSYFVRGGWLTTLIQSFHASGIEADLKQYGMIAGMQNPSRVL
jgi:hypothetical protein